MAGSKSDRKLDGRYTIFANGEKANDAVRVGYIHPKRGYVSGLSVYDANKYAERNPGTQFIITNRDKIRYININEVNKLTNKDILPKSNPSGLVDENDEFDPCNTVRGFRTDPDTLGEPEIKPPFNPGDNGGIPRGIDDIDPDTDGDSTGQYPQIGGADVNYEKYITRTDERRTRIELQGGGGIGAVATPVVGLDGAILYVRVIHGGFGYKFPPQVRIIDDFRRGFGARGISILGSRDQVEENFDEEADVEEYDFTIGDYNYDPDDNPWGKVYSMANQTAVGDWNPANVLSLTNSTGFQVQLREYLAFLKQYDPNKPWWTTRDETPVRVIGGKKSKKGTKLGGILFPVEHPAWGGDISKDDLFVDAEFEVYGQGTHKNRQIYFQFEAEDGSHQFRVKGVTHEARSGKKRSQLVSLKANTTYNVTSNVRKKIKNNEQMKLEQGLLEEAGRRPREAGKLQRDGGRSKTIFADVVGSANDNDDIQLTANIGNFKAGERSGVKFDDSGIQNRSIKIVKSIAKLKSERLDLKQKIKEKIKNNPQSARQLSRQYAEASTEIRKKIKKQQEIAEKLEEIEINSNNKFRRGTFDLTYRVNRRKDITFTKTIKDSFMNRYAVSPQVASDQSGTDRAGEHYSLFYKEHFPHDGVYTFRGSSDNISEVFFDGESVMNISNTFNKKPIKVKKNVKEGLHEIRIDLLNSQQKKIIKETYTADGGDKTKIRTVKFNVVGQGSGRHRKIKAVFTNKADASDNFTIDNDGENKEVRLVYRKVTAGAKYDVKFIATAEKRENPNKETIIPIELAAPGTKGRGKKARIGKVERKKVQYLDEKGDDPNAQLSIDSTSPGLTAKFSDDGTNLITKGNGNVTLKFKWDDDPKSAGKAVGELKVSDKTFKQKGEEGEERQTIDVGNTASGDPIAESTRVYPIKFNNLNPRNNPIEVSGNNKRNQRDALKLRDSTGADVNAKIIIEDVKGGTAKFTLDGKGIEVKGDCDIRITLEWNDDPNIAGKSLDSFEIGGKVWKQEGENGVKTQTINLKGTRRVPKSYNAIIEQGCVENGTKNKETRGSSSRVFADYLGSVNDNDDMQVFVKKGGVFTSSNPRRMNRDGKEGKGRNTFDLEYVFELETGGLVKGLWQDLKDQDIVDSKTGEPLEREDIQRAEVFNTKSFIDKADRKLYRMRPDVGPFGDFFNKNGVTPFNPVELDREIPSVPPTVAPVIPFKKPKTKFVRRDGNLFLKVIGRGKANIGFKLKVDDNLRTSGVFAREVRIQADGPDVRLKRDIKSVRGILTGKEKETVTGDGIFTAGKEYKVHITGGSQTSGFKPVDQTVIFDDDINNGLDENGELSVKYIRPVDEPKSKPAKSPKRGRNNPSEKSLDDATGSCDDYAGIHQIVWKDIKFPASGTYTVDVQVDDNVRLEIFNKRFRAQTLDVRGFRGNTGKSNGKQTFALEVQKGTYTIKALLQQVPGKPIYAGNPMGLAVNIKTAYVTVQKEITLLQSWNQNPFGAALIINAPPPPIPQEPVKEPEGPCPPNPIWTTRHPDTEKWHPCTHRFPNGTRSWSKFMNRYAMSPVLPIGVKGSGYSGQQWGNTWIATIPYTGFYVFKGTVDNFADVTITQEPEDSEVSEITVNEIKKVNGFRTEKDSLTINKVFLEKGLAKIDVIVRNGEVIKYRQVTKKVFNTKDWVSKPTETAEKISVDFDVYGQGSKKNMGLKFLFKEKGGDHSFTIDNVDKSKDTKTVSKRVKRNTEYKVTAIATGTHTIKNEKQEYLLKFEDLNPSNNPIEVSGNNSTNQNDTLKLKDSRGNDANVKFTIMSSSPGVSAKFSDDGRKLITKGNGDVTIRLKYDDNPSYAGEAVRSITIAGTKWTKKRKEYGEETKTIQVGGSGGSGVRKNVTKSFGIKFNNLNSRNNPIEVSGNNRTNKNDALKLRDAGGGDVNAKIIIVDVKGGTAQFSNDGKSLICNGSVAVKITLEWDDNPNIKGKALDSFEIGGKVWKQEGETGTITKTINLDATQLVPAPSEEVKLVPEQGTSKVFGRGKIGTESNQPGQVIFADIIGSANDNDDMQIRCNNGIFTPSNKRKGVKGTSGQGTQKRNTWDLTFKVEAASQAVKNPITYIGDAKYDIKDKELSRVVTTASIGSPPNTAPVILNPTLATYRSGRLGPFLSPFFPNGTRESGSNLQGRTWEMVWENVDFPISGQYKMEIEGDDTLEVFIGDELEDSFRSDRYKSIGKTTTSGGYKAFTFPIAKSGKRDIKLILQNITVSGSTFQSNPTVAACRITCEVPIEVADTRSWLTNPVGISAVLLAPPCKRNIGGTRPDRVVAVAVPEPGNSYPPSGQGGPGVPSQIIISEIVPDKPGIGYTPGDTVSIPGIATDIPITVGEFGKITGIGTGPGIGTDSPPLIITTYPKILIQTRTGVGFVPSIRTELRVDTPEVDPETVIQVTDLAGLKQTGYVEGRPYYGEVFYKDGVPFAGRYETAGRLIQVYATLQESIDAEVTTRPSAIQRSGTDVNSNNPRLNIPGTPENLA